MLFSTPNTSCLPHCSLSVHELALPQERIKAERGDVPDPEIFRVDRGNFCHAVANRPFSSHAAAIEAHTRTSTAHAAAITSHTSNVNAHTETLNVHTAAITDHIAASTAYTRHFEPIATVHEKIGHFSKGCIPGSTHVIERFSATSLVERGNRKIFRMKRGNLPS